MPKRRRRLRDIESVVKTACSISDQAFVSGYLEKHTGAPPSRWSTSWKHPDTQAVYGLGLSQSLNTSEHDLEACFALVEATSRQDYEGSSRGWNPVAKRVEMRDPDLRYILVKDTAGHVCAFTSLMPTMEEGQAVVYCYEIHLESDLRGTGLAELLMGFLEMVAANIQVMEKLMLTVFTCNTRAVKFYQRFGFSTDDASPQPRTLRNGVVKVPDYAIMSKAIEREVAPATRPSIASNMAIANTSSAARPSKMAKVDSSTES